MNNKSLIAFLHNQICQAYQAYHIAAFPGRFVSKEMEKQVPFI